MTTCSSCQYARPHADMFLCRRNAPGAIAETFTLNPPHYVHPPAVWPLVSPDDWCGAYVPAMPSLYARGLPVLQDPYDDPLR